MSLKPLHLLNSALWAANAATWFFYTHSTLMAALSAAACVASLFLARGAE